MDVAEVFQTNTLKDLNNYSQTIKIHFNESVGDTSYVETNIPDISRYNRNNAQNSTKLFDTIAKIKGCTKKDIDTEINECNSTKINTFIKKNFDFRAMKRLKLQGNQKIGVFFTIDEKGLISNIRTRAPHRKLEMEAKRVIALLPRFTPAILNNLKVKMTYFLPITLNMDNNKVSTQPTFARRYRYIKN
ncbi:hypothetical protein N7U66_09795 [Lacinutrix neustonica]|uniref:TonB C-terminal domain-containing protein n=1 Tax=Lacinutrix neustonica TaxID=2980107 RepID=A0A9E8MY49_9FLAO|nr:hypothetical protein [Lacinutrix neustonica]WAC03698.1 hypothetical protein N7U66_09795 [Lacinutrix neustonica]